MNTLKEILETQYANQGIQSLNVFYDSYIFDLKIKNQSEYNNIVLIEKFAFDYDSNNIIRNKNALTLNFGNTELSSPKKSNGNMFIKSILDKKRKLVYLTGIRKMTSGKIIPIIYQYDIRYHTVKPIFPKPDDINQFNDISLSSTYISSKPPVVRLLNSKILFLFETENGSLNYLHRIAIDIKHDSNSITDYDIFSYNNDYDIDFLNLTTTDLVYKFDNHYGFLSNTISDESWDIFALDNSILALSFDDGETAMSLDNFI